MSLLDQVRAHAAATVSQAQFVKLDRERLTAYAATLPIEKTLSAELDPKTHYLGDWSATLAYFVTLDALNFGSGYFPKFAKREGLSGYFTVASSLKDLWTERGPLTAEEMRTLSPEDCRRIFGQQADNPDALELMGFFSRALNDLGVLLGDRYGGSPEKLVEEADGSAERLAELLTAMPFYQDIGFFKRAQLTAADLATAGVACFEDLDQLTVFADNLVPHVLRLDGVLVYDPELVARIEREELIPSGSPEEVEIRAGAVHAVELIAAESRARGYVVSPMQLDYVLWNRGQQPQYKTRPRHRTRSVFY